MKKNSKGQSIIELVFAIGVLVLVLGGVISLIVTSLHTRTIGFDRKKASEMGQKVMETFVEEKVTDPQSFWKSDSNFWSTNIGQNLTLSGYDGYFYNATSNEIGGVTGCTLGQFECVEVAVSVGWSGTDEQVSYSRFFSKK